MKINSPIYTVSHLSKQTVASKTLPGQRTWQLADRRKLSFWKTHSSYFCYLDMTNDCGDCSNTGQWKAGARTYFNLVMMITMRTYILKYPWHWPAMSRGKWPKFLFCLIHLQILLNLRLLSFLAPTGAQEMLIFVPNHRLLHKHSPYHR